MTNKWERWVLLRLVYFAKKVVRHYWEKEWKEEGLKDKSREKFSIIRALASFYKVYYIEVHTPTNIMVRVFCWGKSLDRFPQQFSYALCIAAPFSLSWKIHACKSEPLNLDFAQSIYFWHYSLREFKLRYRIVLLLYLTIHSNGCN